MKIKEYNTEDYYLDNKYTKWYIKLVVKAKDRNLRKGSGGLIENHHILPKSIVKELRLEKSNLVTLTPKEHFIAHLLLTKMCNTKKNYHRMALAFHNMLNTDRFGNRYKPSARIYEYSTRLKIEAVSGENSVWFGTKGNNPMGGTIWMTNPQTNSEARIKKDELESYLKKGYVKGRLKMKGNDGGVSAKAGKLPKTARPVRNKTTGEVFPTAIVAAASLGYTKSAVATAIWKGHKCAGIYWEYAD